MTDEFSHRIQKKAEAHLEACQEALFDEAVRSPAFAPFCGCETCVVREVLQVAWDEMREEARREVHEESRAALHLLPPRNEP